MISRVGSITAITILFIVLFSIVYWLLTFASWWQSCRFRSCGRKTATRSVHMDIFHRAEYLNPFEHMMNDDFSDGRALLFHNKGCHFEPGEAIHKVSYVSDLHLQCACVITLLV